MNDHNPLLQDNAEKTLNSMINVVSMFIAATDKMAANAAAKADHYGEGNPVFYDDLLVIEGLRDGLRALKTTNIAVLEQHNHEIANLTVTCND